MKRSEVLRYDTFWNKSCHNASIRISLYGNPARITNIVCIFLYARFCPETGYNYGTAGDYRCDAARTRLCADVYSAPGLFKKMHSQLMQSSALGVLQKDRRNRKHLKESDVQEFLDALKKVGNLKKETSQTYKLFYRKIISGAELYSDKNGTRVVHLEAYPR